MHKVTAESALRAELVELWGFGVNVVTFLCGAMVDPFICGAKVVPFP